MDSLAQILTGSPRPTVFKVLDINDKQGVLIEIVVPDSEGYKAVVYGNTVVPINQPEKQSIAKGEK